MTALTETQTIILGAGAQRPYNLALPLPEGLHGAAAKMTVARMTERGWLREVDANLRRGEPLWRETGDGRIGTFARPDAVSDRLIYTGVANVAVGMIGGALALRYLIRNGVLAKPDAGFGAWTRTLLWLPVALAAGLALYFGQGAPSADATVILNGLPIVEVSSREDPSGGAQSVEREDDSAPGNVPKARAHLRIEGR